MKTSPNVSPGRHQYYPELDGIRAIAALLVMLFHAAQAGLPIRGPINIGQTGVDLFFVLSGFLITSILLGHRHKDWKEIRIFYIRRSLRIFPLYFAYLILTAIFNHSPSWAYWFYLQNFSLALHKHLSGPTHFWSLAVEEHFYLFWPFLVMFAPRRALLPSLWGMVISAVVLRYLLAFHDIQIFYLTFTRIDGLAAGALLATYHRRGLLAYHANAFPVGTLISACLLAGVSYIGRGHNLPWFIAVKYTVITSMYSLFLASILSTHKSLVHSLLKLRPLRFIGRISYGLYVFHPVIFLIVFKHFTNNNILKGLLGFAISLCAATLSWYLFERHFIRLKDKWAPDRKSPLEANINV